MANAEQWKSLLRENLVEISKSGKKKKRKSRKYSRGVLRQAGIRPQVVVGDDQHRVGTPEEAVRAGATHLVVGRPIYQAEDPKKAFEELCEAAR